MPPAEKKDKGSERVAYVPKTVTIEEILKKIDRPKRAVVTAGMPYANGPLHLGHLAGTQVPADIFARWLGILIGRENVLFVCGTDDHGSTSEVAALQTGKPIREFIDQIHNNQETTLNRYSIGLDVFSGTSRPECFQFQKNLAQTFFRKIYSNGMLEKRTTKQWYDPKMSRFLQDRYVRGRCPNPKCQNEEAYGDECDACGTQYNPEELIRPRSALSDATPILRETDHWWLDMWKVSEVLRVWIQSKKDKWRMPVYNEVIHTVLPSLRIEQSHETRYKELKETLPKHKSKYASGKKIALQFEDKSGLYEAQKIFQDNKIESSVIDGWAYRSVSRDVAWGIPLPSDIDPTMKGKTLYVWPDSLIAPIAFSQVALERKKWPTERLAEFWCDPGSKIYQFLGQDNVYFYTLMQGAMWLGSQKDPYRLPTAGEYQLTEIFGCFHLLAAGEKMSKSKGNFILANQLLDEKGYTADQVRYFLALLSLPEKASNFDFSAIEERNRFLAGPMNAVFEKPISAVHSKFEGRVPQGELLEKIEMETTRMVQRYVRAMERAEYVTLLYAVENYARLVNSLFTQFKPHDDRFPEKERRDALFSCFYILKNILIMLYPFVPGTMEKLRTSLRLDPGVYAIDQLGTSIPSGHQIGEKQEFFPAIPGSSNK